MATSTTSKVSTASIPVKISVPATKIPSTGTPSGPKGYSANVIPGKV
jgi:hypothetical protein